MTKKEESAKRTKERICEALLTCLSTEPFRKITVKKIIETAGVNRSTFYKYYLDKFDLLDYYLEQVLNDFIAEKNYDFVKARKNEIDNPIYSEYFRNSEDFIKRNSKIYKVLWSSEIGSNLYEKMLNIQKANILDTIISDPFYTEDKLPYAILYSNLFASNFMVTIRWWIERDDTVDFEQTSNLMKGNMEKGVFQTFRDILESNTDQK
jgi:AcrR family transcriptional regulator